MQAKLCKFNGKVCHKSENDAKVALSCLKQNKSYNGGVYVCSYCGDFHIGRRIGKRIDRPKKEKRKHVKRTRSIITIYLAATLEGSEQMGVVDCQSSQTPYVPSFYDTGEWQPNLSPQVQSM